MNIARQLMNDEREAERRNRATERAKRAEVRNPLLALPAAARIAALPPEARAALGALCNDLSKEARVKAEQCWRSHKAPMAAYWKAVAVNARHTARLCR